MFIKAVFEATFGLTNILEIIFNTLNQVNYVRCATSDVRFDLIRLASAIKNVLIAAMFDVRTCGTNIFIAAKRAAGEPGVVSADRFR